MAAEVLSANGVAVTLYDRMPTMGRKFLMAGRGGLNLTHSEPFEAFLSRYGASARALRPILDAFPPAAAIAWAQGLGQPTFTGSSGRVFPKAMKASPLLRAWLARLTAQNVQFHTRHEWQGWDESGALLFHVGGETKSGSRGRNHSGAGRRKLAAPGIGRRLDGDPNAQARGRNSIAPVQLRLHDCVERNLPNPLCRNNR